MTLEPMHITLALACFAAVVWAIRQEGRINSQGEKIKALETQITTHADFAVQIAKLETQIANLTDMVKQLLPARRRPTE